MTLKSVLKYWFPDTTYDLYHEGQEDKAKELNNKMVMDEKNHRLEMQILAGRMDEKLAELVEQARKRAYAKGKEDAEDHRKAMITFDEELTFPADFADYRDDEERETIGQFVRMQEFQNTFRMNMVCQAMKKFRDARTAANPQMMVALTMIGNAIIDLVNFYDNAGKKGEESQSGPVDKFSFSSLIEDARNAE